MSSSNAKYQEYLLELKKRRSVRASMDLWSRECGFEPAAHHRLLNRKLEEVASQPDRRVMVWMPPGSAKSTYSSVLFPPFFLAQRSDLSILSASHNDTLAESFGRRARNIVDANPTVLGYSLRPDSKAAGEWQTTNGGLFFCAGVGAKIAGHRADLGLIDDPIGKKEDAESKLIRDKTWDWYLWDFKPRLKPGASVIIIQTRWHEDDLSGRILANEKGWEVISIPLIAEANDPLGRAEGQPLWPEYFSEKLVRDAKESPAFIPLYQQKPTPDSGDYFKVEWLREYQSLAELPTNLRYYAGSDHAVSLKEEADKTCLIPAGVDSNDELWILPDVWWKRAPTDEVVDEMLRLCRVYRINFWWAGREHITASIGPFIRRREMEEHVFVPLEETSSARDKQSRAQPMRGFMKRGQVHFPAFAPWWGDAKGELLRFDKGTHDDFVDALSEIGRGLDKVIGHKFVPPKQETFSSPIITLKFVKDSMKRRESRELLLTSDR
jgi:predicted phage terminase large subunit-like protein